MTLLIRIWCCLCYFLEWWRLGGKRSSQPQFHSQSFSEVIVIFSLCFNEINFSFYTLKTSLIIKAHTQSRALFETSQFLIIKCLTFIEPSFQETQYFISVTLFILTIALCGSKGGNVMPFSQTATLRRCWLVLLCLLSTVLSYGFIENYSGSKHFAEI